jgi:hypothetical protein
VLHINNISIHHIGYAVADIEKAYKVFLLMGYKKYEMQDIVDDYERNVRILMLKNGFILVELISFLDRNKKSPVDFWLGKKVLWGGLLIIFVMLLIISLMRLIPLGKRNLLLFNRRVKLLLLEIN